MLTFLLVAEEGEEYGKDEWENDYNREEKELFVRICLKANPHSREEVLC